MPTRRQLASAVAAAIALSTPAAAQRPPLDTAQLAIRADSFALQANGQPFGTHFVTLTPQPGGGFVFRETTTTGAGAQTTEVELDGAGGMRAVRQEGQMGGAAMRIAVTYADGRARGEARVPGAGDMTELAVDEAVPPDVVDDNVLVSWLQALAWTADASFELPVFAAGKNAVILHTLRATGREEVVVPAGRFDAYRIEVGGGQPLVLHLEATAPHRLLRVQVVGTPMEVVRTGGASP